MSHDATPLAPQPRRRYRSDIRRAYADASRTASYTRFVRGMKLGLAATALLLIVTLVFYSGTFDSPDELPITFTEVRAINDDLRMVSPRLADVDELGRPYTITATSAVQDPDNPSLIHLDEVEGDMTMDQGGGWRSLSARTGLLNSDEEVLDLYTDVALYTDSGFQFHADTLRINLDNGEVTSDQPVNGQGPAGSFEANAFRMEESGDVIQLLNGSKVIIRPGADGASPFGFGDAGE